MLEPALEQSCGLSSVPFHVEESSRLGTYERIGCLYERNRLEGISSQHTEAIEPIAYNQRIFCYIVSSLHSPNVYEKH